MGVTDDGYRAAVPEYRLEPRLWAVVYPVNPHDPIGWIERQSDGFRAQLEQEQLGVYPTGDQAAEAVWGRFLEKVRMQHEVASRTHGGAERH